MNEAEFFDWRQRSGKPARAELLEAFAHLAGRTLLESQRAELRQLYRELRAAKKVLPILRRARGALSPAERPGLEAIIERCEGGIADAYCRHCRMEIRQERSAWLGIDGLDMCPPSPRSRHEPPQKEGASE